MSTINGTPAVTIPTYEEINQSNSGSSQNANGEFSSILSDMLKEHAMKSTMMNTAGTSGQSSGLGGMNDLLGGLGGLGGTNALLGGLGGLGGTNAMMGGMMPSISSGMENTLISAAETGEMSGAQLMLFMMIMMMQSSDSGSDMSPIIQVLAGLLSQFSNDANAGNQANNMVMLDYMQNGVPAGEQSDVKRMVDAALSQLGYRERNRDGSTGNGNFTQFGAWYGMNGQPWCAMFVSWAADQAGILNDVVPKHASTSRGVAAYQERGLYSPRNSGYQPREGDAIYFQSPNGQIQHVGIVVAFDPTTQRVYTVEGNTDNAVRLRHYDIKNPRIHGYGRNGGESFGTIPNTSTSGSEASTR